MVPHNCVLAPKGWQLFVSGYMFTIWYRHRSLGMMGEGYWLQTAVSAPMEFQTSPSRCILKAIRSPTSNEASSGENSPLVIPLPETQQQLPVKCEISWAVLLVSGRCRLEFFKAVEVNHTIVITQF